MLLIGEIGYQFSLYVYCVSMIHADLREGDEPLVHGRLSHLFCSNPFNLLRRHDFLLFASKRLPELSHCLEQTLLQAPQDQFYRRSLAAREVILSKGDIPSPKGKGQVSLKVLTECIIVFLWITLASDIDEQIAPSISGLRWLYQQFNESLHSFMRRSCSISEQIALVFGVLSGSGERSLSSNLLAMAGAGVCVYRQVLLDPHLSPDSISRIQVVPGYISHAGALFKTISDISPLDNRLKFSFDALSTCQSVDFIVQETEQDSKLAAAYQVNYINRQGEKKYLFLGLSVLLSKLQSIVRMFKCKGDCLKLSTKILRDHRPRDHERLSPWQKKTRIDSLVLFDQAASDNAQRLIADFQDFQNLWISTSKQDIWNGHMVGLVDTKILIDRPFMIYLSLMDDIRGGIICVFPLIPCLSCIIERRWLARININDLTSRGSIRLVAPGHAEVELHWERWDPEIPQEPSVVSREKNRKKKRRKNAPESSAGTPC